MVSPRTSPRRAALLLAVLCAAQLAAGCRASREERAAALRARYRVEVAGFVVEQRPLPETGAPAAPALAQDVRVDLRIHRPAAGEDGGGEGEGLETLPVELMLTGPGGTVRGRWPAVLEVPAAAAGAPVRASYLLEGVPYQPGDRFAVEIAAPQGEDAGRP